MKTRNFATGVLAAIVLATLPMSSAWATHRSEAEKAIADAKALQQTGGGGRGRHR